MARKAEFNVSFDLYNEKAVRKLQEEDPDLLPDYAVNSAKDLAYNKQQVNSAIESAILNGKSVDKIAEDLQDRMENVNERSAIKTARTAVTSAQNNGTLDSFYEARDMGINIQKEWVATLDDRTRPSHRELDGERRELDEKFSNGLMYPGDPDGDPEEVYWCRCTLESYMPDVDVKEEDKRITYKEWINEKEGDESGSGYKAKSEKPTQIEGTTKIYEVDLLHPETIGGVKRTAEEMTYFEADEGKTNPNYKDDVKDGYHKNCQTCVVANEARRRGYDVIALEKNDTSEKVARDTNLAWIDPETGAEPFYLMSMETTSDGLYEYLDQTIGKNERYTLGFTWKSGRGGHIVSLERTKDNSLILTDNQRSYPRSFSSVEIKQYLDRIDILSAQITRIDNKAFNEEIVNKILGPAERK